MSFLGGFMLVYQPHSGIQCYDLDDTGPDFPIFHIHVTVSVDLSKCDFSTDDSKVQLNQKLHSVGDLQIINGKLLNYTSLRYFYKYSTPKYIWYIVVVRI